MLVSYSQKVKEIAPPFPSYIFCLKLQSWQNFKSKDYESLATTWINFNPKMNQTFGKNLKLVVGQIATIIKCCNSGRASLNLQIQFVLI